VTPQLVLTIQRSSTLSLAFASIVISEYARSRVLSSTSSLNFTHDFITYLDDIVILSRPRLRPLPSPPVSPTATFNPFSDFDPLSPQTPLNDPSTPPPLSFPVSRPSPSVPPFSRHGNVHEVDGTPSTGYLSDPIFVRLLPPNGPFVSFTSWFLCEHEGFRHTQTYLTTTDVRTGVTTSSPVDELTFYVTPQPFTPTCALKWSRLEIQIFQGE
jgi:hypothetical protein